MRNKFKYNFFNVALFSILLLSSLSVVSQTTKVTGKIVDAISREPLPFVNIIFNGGRYGQDRTKDYLNILVTLKDLVLNQYQVIGIIAILSVYIATIRQGRQNIFQIKALKIYSLLLISGLVLIAKESLPRDFLFISPILAVILLILVI